MNKTHQYEIQNATTHTKSHIFQLCLLNALYIAIALIYIGNIYNILQIIIIYIATYITNHRKLLTFLCAAMFKTFIIIYILEIAKKSEFCGIKTNVATKIFKHFY